MAFIVNTAKPSKVNNFSYNNIPVDVEIVVPVNQEMMLYDHVEVEGNLIIDGDVAFADEQPVIDVVVVTNDILLDGSFNVVLCNSINPVAITLPLPSGYINRQYIIKNINTGVVSVLGTIDGVLNYSLPTQYKFVIVISNGVEWYIIGSN
jgi:hypothetical protein